MSDAYRVAPGRAIKGDDGYEYAEGAEIKCLCPRDVETFLTDGTIVRVDGPPPPAQPRRKSVRTQGLDPVAVP